MHMKRDKKEALDRKLDASLVTPTDLKSKATKDIAGAMNAILADVLRSTSKRKTSTGT